MSQTTRSKCWSLAESWLNRDMSKFRQLKHSLKRMIDIRAFVLGISIACLISGLITFFFHCPFWMTFFLVVFAMVINGIIAEWEDNQPGGFNNPD